MNVQSPSSGLAAGAVPSPAESLLRILAGIAVLVCVVVMVVSPINNNDIWLQLRIGQMIVDTGKIPDTLLFPFGPIADNAFHAHEWLASVLVHLFERQFGNHALIWLQAGLGLIEFWLAYLLARRVSGHLALSLLLALLAMMVANYRHLLRPEMYTVILLLAQLLTLETYAANARPRTLLWCLPIALLWANLHAAFVLGPAVALIYAGGTVIECLLSAPASDRRASMQGAARKALPYLGVALGMTLVSIVNPEGWRLLVFPFVVHGSGAIREGIAEWMPTLSPEFARTPGVIIFEIALMATTVVVLALRRHLDWTHGLLLIAFALLGLDRHRFMVFFGFIALLTISVMYRRWAREERHRIALLSASIVAAIAGTGVVLGFGNALGCRPWECSESDNMTILLIDALARPEVSGNMFTSYELGAEVIYRAWPRVRPSIDSRVDSYGDEYFRLHRYATYDDKTMEEYTRASNVRYVLLTWRDMQLQKDRPLLKAHWHRLTGDHRMILLERNASVEDARAP